ncbi:hypothetical protein ACFLUV_01120 [Elusimicrobiota bacterium]
MNKFEKVFGTSKNKINKNCILLPANDRGLFKLLKISKVHRGMFFDVADCEQCSLISIRHRSFAGDCVLMLEDTDCANLILFGSCGGLSGSIIGEKAVIEKSLNLESFSSFLNIDNTIPEFIYPDRDLTDRFISYTGADSIEQKACAAVSSLVLEERNVELLSSLGISCVDMESSMVFAAARETKRKAMAVLYVTDLPGEHNFYDDYSNEIKEKIKGARRSVADTLSTFIHELS